MKRFSNHRQQRDKRALAWYWYWGAAVAGIAVVMTLAVPLLVALGVVPAEQASNIGFIPTLRHILLFIALGINTVLLIF